MGSGVNHLNALLSQRGQRSAQTGQAVGNAGVVLDVGIVVKVTGSFLRMPVLHHINEEILHKSAVFLSLIQVFQLHRAIDLRAAGRIRSGFRCQVVPVFSDQAVFVKAEDVKSHLLACAGEVVDGLQKYPVAVLKSPDVVHRGFDGSRSQIFDGPDKGIAPCAIGRIVLDIPLGEQVFRFFGITGSEGADQFKCFLNVCHFNLHY